MEMQPPIPGKLGEEIGLLLAIASQLFTTRVGQVVGGTDLTYTQFTLLSHLDAHPESSISELAAAMEINQPGVSKVVQRLSEMGLVAVAADREDSRRRRVSLATPGLDALARTRAALAEDGAAWFADWERDDLVSFRDQLATLVSWLDANRRPIDQR